MYDRHFFDMARSIYRRDVARNDIIWLARLSKQLDAGIGDEHAITDTQTRGRRLADRRPAAVVVLDADLVDDLRLRFLDLVADVATAQRADDGRDRSSRAASDQGAEAASDEPAEDQTGAA